MKGRNQPKERPILFSGEMVRAILTGRKTQTRRVIRRPFTICYGRIAREDKAGRFKPYPCSYCPGDRLWVRETWAELEDGSVVYREKYMPDNLAWANIKWRPSIYMPRRICRLFLRVVDVRYERLQDITEADAIAEGVSPAATPIHAFRELWDRLNVKRGYGWDVNPWVWRVEFEEKKVESGSESNVL